MTKMAKYLSPTDVWAVAFGCMIGWGVFVMPGTTYLPVGGPAGALASLALSAALMLVIGRNYSFLMERRPGTGGIYSYTKEAFGRDHAFVGSWFLSLSYLTIVFLNATALFIVGRIMFGSAMQAGIHYQIAGYEVYFSEIVLSAIVLVVTGVLFVYGKPILQKLQQILGIVLAAGIVLLSIIILPHVDIGIVGEFAHDSSANPAMSIVALSLLAPWAFVGFDIVSLETAHFRFDVKKSWRIIALAICMAGLAYMATTLMSIAFIPDGFSSWWSYLDATESLTGPTSVPSMYAALQAGGAIGLVVAAITAVAAILTGIIGGARDGAHAVDHGRG